MLKNSNKGNLVMDNCSNGLASAGVKSHRTDYSSLAKYNLTNEENSSRRVYQSALNNEANIFDGDICGLPQKSSDMDSANTITYKGCSSVNRGNENIPPITLSSNRKSDNGVNMIANYKYDSHRRVKSILNSGCRRNGSNGKNSVDCERDKKIDDMNVDQINEMDNKILYDMLRNHLRS